MGDVHYPRRTLPPSDHTQQHGGSTTDTIDVNSLRRTERVAAVRPGLIRGQPLLLSQEFHMFDPDTIQRSNQSMKSSPSGNTLS